MPGGDYRDALRDRAGWVPEAGPLLDRDGERVGEHHGTPAYTIGQRQGLGVALGEPRYVSRIDPLTNTITLGRREDLETTTIELERRASSPATRRAVPVRSAPRSGSGTARPRSRPRLALRRPTEPPRGAIESSRRIPRSGPPHRGRPPSCTTARSSSVAGASLDPGQRSRTPPAHAKRPSPRRLVGSGA